MASQTEYGLAIIRCGLSGVLLWFGSQQLIHPQDWVGYVPAEVVQLAPFSAHTIVLMNGAAEIAFGSLILLGIFTRISALFMAVHLAGIAFSLGLTAVAVRDWGLVAALLGLVFTGAGAFGLDRSDRQKIPLDHLS